jgi:hypothetical protein
MMIVYVSIAVALVCFILYALDRRSKQEQIDWFTGAKIMIFGGLMSGGIVYITQTPEILEVVKEIQTEVPVVQEMFVGKPTF